jgi:hypothetical protein
MHPRSNGGLLPTSASNTVSPSAPASRSPKSTSRRRLSSSTEARRLSATKRSSWLLAQPHENCLLRALICRMCLHSEESRTQLRLTRRARKARSWLWLAALSLAWSLLWRLHNAKWQRGTLSAWTACLSSRSVAPLVHTFAP